MTLEGLRFAEPLWLLALLLAPAVVLAAWWRERTCCAVMLPALSERGRVVSSWRVQLRYLPVVLAALALAASAVALARPQRGALRHSVITQGVDIIVALDTSYSMAAEDLQPDNRLAVAKRVVADFVRERRQDRVGLVVFAGKALTKTPPTTDVGLLLHQLDTVELGVLADGTAIGSGLATALARLRRSPAKSKVIILVTDGANNTGEIDPVTAADIAAAMEVKIYTIGVGKGGLVPIAMPVEDVRTGDVKKVRRWMRVEIDEDLLKRIAARTKGEFFRASDAPSLRMIFDRIDALEKSEIRHVAYTRYRELFSPVLRLAALLLALAGVVWAMGLRVLPV
jgi:Ca-activated chloride channel family protein